MLSVSEQLGDDVGRLLAPGVGGALEPLGIPALDADQDDQPGVGVAAASFYMERAAGVVLGAEEIGHLQEELSSPLGSTGSRWASRSRRRP